MKIVLIFAKYLLVFCLLGSRLAFNFLSKLQPNPITEQTSSNTTINAVETGSVENVPLSSDWPQIQNNPQHTGYTPEQLGTTIQVKWTHPFQPEKVFPQTQVIVYSGRVYVGTESGNMYAFDAVTGVQAWIYRVGFPILSSVAAGNNKVIFGAMDGTIYGLDAATGLLVWENKISTRLGFSTAPVLAENKIMLGGRDGIFYALNVDNGNLLWKYPVGSPILQTAAYNNGRVFFGAMDMVLYALNTANGALSWKSARIPGMGFKDYWPVVIQGAVYIRPMGMGSFGLPDSNRANVTDPTAQQALLADYALHPQNYKLNLFRFNETNGQILPPVIDYTYQTMNGAVSPPCIDRNGYMITPVPFPSGYKTGWGRLNLSTRIITSLLNDGTGAGFGNPDENMNLTCTGNLILAIHTEEYNAQYTGAFNLDTGKWTLIYPGNTNRQLSTNTQGGGGNPASVANGMIFHISFNELIARVATP